MRFLEMLILPAIVDYRISVTRFGTDMNCSFGKKDKLKTRLEMSIKTCLMNIQDLYELIYQLICKYSLTQTYVISPVTCCEDSKTLQACGDFLSKVAY
jgi:hypothetical protein